jgi:hypothetical protein
VGVNTKSPTTARMASYRALTNVISNSSETTAGGLYLSGGALWCETAERSKSTTPSRKYQPTQREDTIHPIPQTNSNMHPTAAWRRIFKPNNREPPHLSSQSEPTNNGSQIPVPETCMTCSQQNEKQQTRSSRRCRALTYRCGGHPLVEYTSSHIPNYGYPRLMHIQ